MAARNAIVKKPGTVTAIAARPADKMKAELDQAKREAAEATRRANQAADTIAKMAQQIEKLTEQVRLLVAQNSKAAEIEDSNKQARDLFGAASAETDPAKKKTLTDQLASILPALGAKMNPPTSAPADDDVKVYNGRCNITR